jgi:hypothetical protein
VEGIGKQGVTKTRMNNARKRKRKKNEVNQEDVKDEGIFIFYIWFRQSSDIWEQL